LREARVALVPETLAKVRAAGHTVVVETGAGVRAGHSDDAYREAGAEIAPDFAATVKGANAILKVREPSAEEVAGYPESAALLGLLGRGENADLMGHYRARKLSVFSLHALPRTSRAQKMDALSSMAAVAGYKAVLLAAANSPKFFPLLMTAAGTVAPSRVLILGAGVAGLQAIATARRLGAVVEAFDVRPAVKEEVMSLGATFLDLPLGESGVGAGGYAKELDDQRQQQVRDLIQGRLPHIDVLITTASIPGRKAPTLVTASMASHLKAGAVVVDLAAESGGNCELTVAGETVQKNGATFMGPLDIAASVPKDASQMYARNLLSLVLHLSKDGALNVDLSDDITRGTCLTHEGRTAAELAPAATAEKPA
jgi:NAD(P) transhydrogenase subunit alpha